MIEKMKFVNIIGFVKDLERVKLQYLSNYDIQLEDASKEKANSSLLLHFEDTNIYQDYLKKADLLSSIVTIEDECKIEVSKEDALRIIDEVSLEEYEYFRRAHELEEQKSKLLNECDIYKPFIDISVRMDDLYKMNYIICRFGKLPRTGYLQLETYLNAQPNIIFDVCAQNMEYTWGVYYTPVSMEEQADSLFRSLHFEEIMFPILQAGKPSDIYDDLQEEIKNIETQIDDITDSEHRIIISRKEELSAAVKKIRELYDFFNMRKYIAHTPESFFVIAGWMTEADASMLESEITDDEKIIFTANSDLDSVSSKPPIRLKNPKPFRPFEFFVKMYGFPSYNEIDPTIFLAITYSLLFGIMFGDLGQGFLLSLFGFTLYKIKRFALGAIIGIVGCFSMFFGFMYGSFFGYEHVIPTIWMKPLDSFNDTLIIAVAIGIIIIASTMILHIVNAIKANSIADAIFHSNGVAGMIFYGTIVYVFFMVLMSRPIPPTWLIAIPLGISILAMALKEPLAALINRESKLIHGNAGSFISQTFFEMFEVILGYITNTISFIRVGAFVLSHAGMMTIVLILADAEKGTGNIFIMIIGNLVVMLIEGLVVGIQVLRLEYYEIFSHFFSSDGREFKPFISSSKKTNKI